MVCTRTNLSRLALARLGRHEEALATIPRGVADYRAAGHEMAIPRFLVLLAEAHGRAGQAGEGLGVLAEALVIVQRDGDRNAEAAEALPHRGELLLAVSAEHQDEAEASLRRALDIARRQQAKSPELRATVEPGSAARETRRSQGGPRDAGGDLRLVHRGLRHRYSKGGQDTA